jgi:hypothetical protein
VEGRLHRLDGRHGKAAWPLDLSTVVMLSIRGLDRASIGRMIAEVLRLLAHGVWRDDELLAHLSSEA